VSFFFLSQDHNKCPFSFFLRIIINAEATYIKMVSEQFDRCHGILLQYVEFLSSAITPTSYAQLMPPLQDLVYKYHIEPEVTHFVCVLAPIISTTLLDLAFCLCFGFSLNKHSVLVFIQVAFLIYRPVMRLFKSTIGGDICWPLDDNEEGESVSSDDLILQLDSSREPIM
jgi:THO complex subunit 2